MRIILESIRKFISSAFLLDGDPIFSRIFQSSVIILFAKVANAVLLLIINLVVARVYNTNIVGILALLNSFLNITFLFNLAGLQAAVLRIIPEYKTKFTPGSAREVWRRTRNLVIVLSPIISTATLLIGLLWKRLIPDSVISIEYFLIIAVLTPFFSLTRLNTESLRAFFFDKLYALANILPALVNLVILIFLASSRLILSDPLIAFSLSNLIVWIITYFFLLGILPQKVKDEVVSEIPYIELVSISLPMGVSMGINQVMNYLDTLLLGIFKSEADVGIYSTAVKLAILTSFIIHSVNAVSASKFSDLHFSNRNEELKNLVEKSSNLIFWISLPVLIILIALGKTFLNVFGDEYVAGYPALVILVLSQFFDACGGSNNVFLNMTGHQNTMKNIMLLTLMVYVSLNVLLIPQLGIIGCAVAKLISTIFWNTTATIVIFKRTGVWVSYLPQSVRKQLNNYWVKS